MDVVSGLLCKSSVDRCPCCDYGPLIRRHRENDPSWSRGADWPAGGEIDTIEGVNNQVSNQMALHTSNGCTLTQSTSAYTGTTNSTDCYVGADDNAGCAVSDGNADSYGQAFAAAGGGVWVTELSTQGAS
jgi:hypothetical protein